jgi:hypothetical protein
MEKPPNAYVAVFGEEKKNSAVSATRKRVNRLFDHERSPSE